MVSDSCATNNFGWFSGLTSDAVGLTSQENIPCIDIIFCFSLRFLGERVNKAFGRNLTPSSRHKLVGGVCFQCDELGVQLRDRFIWSL